MQKCVLLILFFLLSYSISHGNTPTTDTLSVDSLESRPAFFKRMYKNVYRYFTEANQEKETKRFDFSVIGGPHFSSDTKLGLGLVASGLYRVDREHLTLPPSNISFYGDVTTTGFYLLGIRGRPFLKKTNTGSGSIFTSFLFRVNTGVSVIQTEIRRIITRLTNAWRNKSGWISHAVCFPTPIWG